jgi:acyl-CoA synthetase (AMP-forming)/AMP-acid ligase II
VNVSKNLESAAFYFPDRTAVIEAERRFSYKELNQETNRIPTVLMNLGLQPGDHVALCAPGSVNWLSLYHSPNNGCINLKTQRSKMKDSITIRNIFGVTRAIGYSRIMAFCPIGKYLKL